MFSVLYDEHNVSLLYRDLERSRNRVHSVFSSMWFISETDSGTDILIESSGCCTPYLADVCVCVCVCVCLFVVNFQF